MKFISRALKKIISRLNLLKLLSRKGKNVPCIFNNWANFYKGKFISNTILNANSFKKLIK